MTEGEAKTKWCPFVRAAADNGPSINRFDGKPSHSSFCIASACMAWRTRHEWLDNAQEKPTWVTYSPYAFEPGPDQEREAGFCGLAGQP